MARVITFSRTFPSYHSKAGQPTFFVEKFWESVEDSFSAGNLPGNILFSEQYRFMRNDFTPKHHTIRAGHRWKVGDWFRPKVWGDDINPKSGRSGPYHSKQIQFAPDTRIKKVWNFSKDADNYYYFINGRRLQHSEVREVAANDGLDIDDFDLWFPPSFEGQIICWNENIEY